MIRPRILHVLPRLDMDGPARLVIAASRRMLERFDVAIAAGPPKEGDSSLRREAISSRIPVWIIPSLRRRGSLLAERRAQRELGEARDLSYLADKVGLLADPGDAGGLAGAALLLLGDSKYRAELAGNAREEAGRRFSRWASSPGLESVYTDLLGQPGGRGRSPDRPALSASAP